MTKLNDRPVRRRARAARPKYPCKLSLGAVALLTVVAGTAMGCANLVETANGDEATDDDLNFHDLDKPAWIQTPPDEDWDDPDGDYAGGIGEEWVEEGGGGVGGDDGVGGGGFGGDYAS